MTVQIFISRTDVSLSQRSINTCIQSFCHSIYSLLYFLLKCPYRRFVFNFEINYFPSTCRYWTSVRRCVRLCFNERLNYHIRWHSIRKTYLCYSNLLKLLRSRHNIISNLNPLKTSLDEEASFNEHKSKVCMSRSTHSIR